MSLFIGLRGRGQPVEKLLRALLCPRFGDGIRRFRSVLDLFSRSLGEPTWPTTTFSTRWGVLRSSPSGSSEKSRLQIAIWQIRNVHMADAPSTSYLLPW